MKYSKFNIYSSTDVGAPTLDGTTGSFSALLRACLVTGYGNSAAAGWTLAYSSSNDLTQCAIRQPSGSMLYLSINDSGSSATAGTKDARVCGLEDATGWNSGSLRFPTVAQGIANTGGYLTTRKSITANSVQRQWMVFADAYTCYYFAFTDSTVTLSSLLFGDIYSLKTDNDPYKCMIIANTTENSSQDPFDNVTSVGNSNTGHFLARSFTGVPGSILCCKFGNGSMGGSTLLGTVQYPNGPDKTVYMAPLYVAETVTSAIRGRLRGIWFVAHAITNFSFGDVIQGTGETLGRTFVIMKGGGSGGSAGFWAVEISPTIETNY